MVPMMVPMVPLWWPRVCW